MCEAQFINPNFKHLQEKIMTIFEAYNNTKKKLEAAGIEDYVFEAKQIIMHLTGLTAPQILTNYNNRLTQFQENNLIALIHQREVRYPLQYIFGSWDFYGRAYRVGPGVLIPRADTETVIEEALETLKGKAAPEILDLCAGSGCIGITLAKEIPDSNVTMVEKFEEALRYTLQNIEKNEASNAAALQGDIFKGTANNKKYDLIVSNPPYISEAEMKYTSPEVKFEPETALKASDDGLEFYKAIIENYKASLKADGAFVFEVGFKQAHEVSALLKEKGFKNINIRNDLNGIGRAVTGGIKNGI